MSEVTESQVIPIGRVAETQQKDRVGDVIFVHGLNGNGKEYWMKGTDPIKFWPRWVADDIENVGVWSIAYPASAFRWQGATMSLDKRVGNVINLLQTNDLGTQRPVVFITHSLGGLLVKQMLQSANTKMVANAESLVEQTKGIVFISTPHEGAELANFIENLGLLLQTTELVNTLKKDNPDLEKLNIWFRNNFDDLNLKIQAFCEGLETPLRKEKIMGMDIKNIKKIVVDCNSANPKLPNVNLVELENKDHITICQPEDRGEKLYKNVLPFIQECLLDEDNDEEQRVTNLTDEDNNEEQRVTNLTEDEMTDFITNNLIPLPPQRLQNFFVKRAREALTIMPLSADNTTKVNTYIIWLLGGEGDSLQEGYKKVQEFVKKN